MCRDIHCDIVNSKTLKFQEEKKLSKLWYSYKMQPMKIVSLYVLIWNQLLSREKANEGTMGMLCTICIKNNSLYIYVISLEDLRNW